MGCSGPHVIVHVEDQRKSPVVVVAAAGELSWPLSCGLEIPLSDRMDPTGLRPNPQEPEGIK